MPSNRDTSGAVRPRDGKSSGRSAGSPGPAATKPRGKVGKVLATARSFELFAFRPTPQVREKYYGSNVGIVVSLVVVGIMLAYFASTFRRFFDGNFSVVLLSKKGTYSEPAGTPAFPFALTLPNIHNTSYFSVTVQHRTIPTFGATTSVKVTIPMTHQIDTDGRDMLVVTDISKVPPLFGDCQTQACGYIRIKIFPCSADTLPGGIGCVPLEEISAIVDTNYMRLKVFLRDQLEELDQITDVSLKTFFSFRRQFRFDLLNTFNRPDYFQRWYSVDYYDVTLGNDVFSIDRIPRLTTGPDTEMCKLDFELTGMIVTKKNKPQTSLDLIGQWAAFYSAIFGILSIAMVKYNMFQFYKERPKWDNFDDEFVSAKEEEDEDEEANAGAAYLDEADKEPQWNPPKPKRSQKDSLTAEYGDAAHRSRGGTQATQKRREVGDGERPSPSTNKRNVQAARGSRSVSPEAETGPRSSPGITTNSGASSDSRDAARPSASPETRPVEGIAVEMSDIEVAY